MKELILTLGDDKHLKKLRSNFQFCRLEYKTEIEFLLLIFLIGQKVLSKRK